MPTSISIPSELLERIDRVARSRDMSRSRYITVVLEHAVHRDDDWPSTLFDRLIESARTARVAEREGNE